MRELIHQSRITPAVVVVKIDFSATIGRLAKLACDSRRQANLSERLHEVVHDNRAKQAKVYRYFLGKGLPLSRSLCTQNVSEGKGRLTLWSGIWQLPTQCDQTRDRISGEG